MAGHGKRSGQHGARASASSEKLELDLDVIVKHLRARLPGIVISRTRKGKDVNGLPFVPYSPEYAKARLAAGRVAGVSLWLTGGMVGSFALRSERRSSEGLRMYFAPDAVQSPALTLTASGAKASTRLTPPHNTLGYYHHKGKGDNPKRRWMGLTKAERRKVAKEIEKLSGVWKLGDGWALKK